MVHRPLHPQSHKSCFGMHVNKLRAAPGMVQMFQENTSMELRCCRGTPSPKKTMEITVDPGGMLKSEYHFCFLVAKPEPGGKSKISLKLAPNASIICAKS